MLQTHEHEYAETRDDKTFDKMKRLSDIILILNHHLQDSAEQRDVQHMQSLLNQLQYNHGEDDAICDYPPLHCAVASLCADETTKLEIVNFLLDHGACVNGSILDTTPLHVATWDDANVKIAELLLARGARVEELNGHDQTPLISAIKHCCPAMVKILLEHGAKVDKRASPSDRRWDATPLPIAVSKLHKYENMQDKDDEVLDKIKRLSDIISMLKKQFEQVKAGSILSYLFENAIRNGSRRICCNSLLQGVHLSW